MPAHEPYELSGNSGSQAGSTIHAGDRIVCLSKGFKYLSLFVVGNANSRVSNFDAHSRKLAILVNNLSS